MVQSLWRPRVSKSICNLMRPAPPFNWKKLSFRKREFAKMFFQTNRIKMLMKKLRKITFKIIWFYVNTKRRFFNWNLFSYFRHPYLFFKIALFVWEWEINHFSTTHNIFYRARGRWYIAVTLLYDLYYRLEVPSPKIPP